MDKLKEIKEKDIITKGDTLYTILRHVSKSGLYRVISVYVIKNNKPILLDYYLLDIFKYDKKHGGLKVSGGGMDMGYHVVYTVATKLFGNGYDLNHAWL